MTPRGIVDVVQRIHKQALLIPCCVVCDVAPSMNKQCLTITLRRGVPAPTNCRARATPIYQSLQALGGTSRKEEGRGGRSKTKGVLTASATRGYGATCVCYVVRAVRLVVINSEASQLMNTK